MSMQRPRFVKNASNVYRTKTFIVRQEISLGNDPDGMNVTFSRDTMYLRTPKRDKEYEEYYSWRKYLNGRRLPSTIYTRRYIY